MAIGVYLEADPGAALSESGAHTKEFIVALDGKRGGVLQRRLYVRNSDSALRYTTVVLDLYDAVNGTQFINNPPGFTWKLSEGSLQPIDDEWDEIIPNTPISMPDIGDIGLPDTSTYFPFWVRVEIPRNTPVQTVKDIQFRLNAQEILI